MVHWHHKFRAKRFNPRLVVSDVHRMSMRRCVCVRWCIVSCCVCYVLYVLCDVMYCMFPMCVYVLAYYYKRTDLKTQLIDDATSPTCYFYAEMMKE